MEKGNCNICNKEATFRCSLCRSIFYCCKEHQKNDWKSHKQNCKPATYQKDQDKKLGRFLIANEDMKADTLIFKDKPLIIGPKFGAFDLYEFNLSVSFCVGCFKEIDQEKEDTLECIDCGLPVCSDECTKQYFHKTLECRLFNEAVCKKIHSEEIGQSIAAIALGSLLYLRCVLLKFYDEKKYETLLSFQSSAELREDLPNLEKTTRVFESFKKILIGLEHQTITTAILSKVDCHKILGIIDTNGVDIKISDNFELIGLYPTFSIMEHSCFPSTKYYFSSDPSKKYLYELHCRTSTKLAKGAHLSCCYTNMLLWNTEKRRDYLKKFKHFWCECERCIDPQELGTNFSTIICPLPECKSYCVPVPKLTSSDPSTKQSNSQAEVCNTLAQETDTIWKCLKCGKICEKWQVKQVDAKLSEMVSRTPTKLNRYKELLEKINELVHPGYYLNFIINHSLVQMLAKDSETRNNKDELDEKIKLCTKLLNTIKMLDPGLSKLNIYAGVLYYEMQSAILATAGGEHDDDFPILRQNIESVKLAQLYLQKCIDCFEYELIDLPETKLKILANKKMEYLNIILRNKANK